MFHIAGGGTGHRGSGLVAQRMGRRFQLCLCCVLTWASDALGGVGLPGWAWAAHLLFPWALRPVSERPCWRQLLTRLRSQLCNAHVTPSQAMALDLGAAGSGLAVISFFSIHMLNAVP